MNTIAFMNERVASSSSPERLDRFANLDDLPQTGKPQEPNRTRRRKASDKQAKLLPEHFRPLPESVIIGKSRISKDAEGNFRLKSLAASFLDKYAAANTKAAKSKIVSSIVEMVRSTCPTGAFIKQNERDGRWYECPNSVAREKVGYCFRDLLGDRYKSSAASKAAKRRLVKQSRFHSKASTSDSDYDNAGDNYSDSDDSNMDTKPRAQRPSAKERSNAVKTGQRPLLEDHDTSAPLSMVYSDLEPLPLHHADGVEDLQPFDHHLSILHSTSTQESKETEEAAGTYRRQSVSPTPKWYEDMQALMSITEKDEPPLDIGNLMADLGDGSNNNEDG